MSTNFGKVAYDAYIEKAKGRSLVTGSTLPQWDNLPSNISEAWEVAAEAVIRRYDDEVADTLEEEL